MKILNIFKKSNEKSFTKVNDLRECRGGTIPIAEWSKRRLKFDIPPLPLPHLRRHRRHLRYFLVSRLMHSKLHFSPWRPTCSRWGIPHPQTERLKKINTCLATNTYKLTTEKRLTLVSLERIKGGDGGGRSLCCCAFGRWKKVGEVSGQRLFLLLL